MILIWFLKKSGLFEKKNEAGDVIQAAEPYILFVYPLSTVSDLPGQAFRFSSRIGSFISTAIPV
jgi:hypothetical protein